MSHYRRAVQPGGTFFFTVVTYRRRQWLVMDAARAALRDAIARTRERHSFCIDAWVLMPDHLHCVWTLPPGDADFALRWGLIKRRVSMALGGALHVPSWMNASKAKHRERTLWQRRYFEHTIRDEADFGRCVDYLHGNPVKHGLVSRVADWEWSSFHRYVADAIYAPDWAGAPTADAIGER